MVEQAIDRDPAAILALRGFLERVYRPCGVRLGILTDYRMDQGIQRTLEEFITAHGMIPARRLAKLGPRPREGNLRSEDLVDFLTRYGHEYQVVLLQTRSDHSPVLDIGSVTAAGHAAGCVVGWKVAGMSESDRRLIPSWNADFTF